MTPDDYKHTWTLSSESLILRAYCWLWAAEPSKANFCKLFWGYILFPLALLGHLLAPIGRRLDKAGAKKKRQSKPRKRKTVFSEDTPDRAGAFFAKPSVRLVLKVVGISLLALIAIGVGGLVVWALISDWLKFLLTVLLIVGGAVAGIAILAVCSWLVALWDRGKFEGLVRFGRFLWAGARAVKANTCPRIDVQGPTR